MRKLHLLASSLLFTILTFVGLPALASYPHPTEYPSPMGPIGDSFFLTKGYNADGTLIINPVVSVVKTTIEVNGAQVPVDSDGRFSLDQQNYLLKKLSSNDSITFPSEPSKDGKTHPKAYVVYSVVPLYMTIPYAYDHLRDIGLYYDITQNDINFPDEAQLPIPGPSQLTSVDLPAPEPTAVPYDTSTKVFLVKNAKFFIPNLPNSPNSHDGSTENIYWTVDPWVQNPNTLDTNHHMLPYGWALSPTADQAVIFQNIAADGGSLVSQTDIQQTQPLFNYWKTLFTLQDDAIIKILNLSNKSNNSAYPFPQPVWLQKGLYMPYQPMPGFQRNLVNLYTPWGTWNLLNNTSGLFVRTDGSVELPAYQDQQNSWQKYPLVVQTWDDTQRFTVLNQTDGTIPSSFDQYPGDENYYAGNIYLPGNAGVLSSYKNYKIYDNTNSYNPRQPDIWLGLKGARIEDLMTWDFANGTEPGGQGNKPYMLGADISSRTSDIGKTFTAYTIRLEQANSFMIAELPHTGKNGYTNQMYSASLYVDTTDGRGYQRIATLSFDWKPWKIDNNGNWVSREQDGTGLGAWVPVISNITPDTALQAFISVSQGSGWKPAPERVMPWKGLGIYADNASAINQLGSPVYKYTLNASITDAANPNAAKAKFLVVLNSEKGPKPPTDNYALVPPYDAKGAAVTVTANIPSDKPSVHISGRYAFNVTTPETATITQIGDKSLTCKLSLDSTHWNLTTDSNSECVKYFTAKNASGAAGDITMQVPAPTPPPINVFYTLVVPKVDNNGVHVTANMDGYDISTSSDETIPVSSNANHVINITGIGDQTVTACSVTLNATGWSLNPDNQCSQFFVPPTKGGPNSSITLTTQVPVPPVNAGYYELVPNFHNGQADSIEVTASSGVSIVQPQTPVPPGAVVLAVTAHKLNSVLVPVTAINTVDPSKTAICVLSMNDTSWSVSNNQPTNADCSKFPASGSAGTALSSPSIIGIATPDKSATPIPPPPQKGLYYALVPGNAANTINVTGVPTTLSSLAPGAVLLNVADVLANASSVDATVTVSNKDKTNSVSCTLSLRKDGWSDSGCPLFPISGGAPGNTPESAQVIGIGPVQ